MGGDLNQGQDEDQDENQILHPGCTLEIGCETITVREFSFGETLMLGPVLSDIIRDMDAVLGDPGAGVQLAEVLDVLYRHPKALSKMLCLSTGKDAKWLLRSLKSVDGERLVMAFWGANGPFFARRVAARRMAARVGQRQAKST